MTNIITKKVLLLAVTLLLAPATQAQEYIKEVVNNPSEFSIIREYKEDIRIIYSEKGDDKQFMMVTESGATATLLNLKDEMYIRDFEIMGDTLYCCGFRYLNQLYGFFGWIDLTAFTTSLFGFFFPDLYFFNRIEVFKSANGGERHAVITNGGVLIDALITASPSSWNFYYSNADSSWTYFDDVAVTDNQVVASVRDDDKHGYVYCFNHPVPGNTFLVSPQYKYDIGGNITSQIILEYCEPNYFVSACQRITNEQSYMIEVRSYNMSSYTHQLENIPVDNDLYIPKDLKFGRHDKMLDLLIHENSSYPYHYIQHLSTMGPIFSYKCRSIPDHWIYSIDYLNSDTNHFIASGWGKDGELRFFKYNPGYNGKCTDWFYPDSWESTEREYLKKLTLFVYQPTKTAIPIGKQIEEKDVKTRCYYDLKKDLEK